MAQREVIQLYHGHDPRESVGTHVFLHSVWKHTSVPVAACALHRPMLPEIAVGSNAFTFSRFLIPYLQHWTGYALFMDGADMLCRADLKELMELRTNAPVAVVKHDYKTRHPRKYIGTPMEAHNSDYERKNWASVMLINCGHYAWRAFRPEWIAKQSGLSLLQFHNFQDSDIASLPFKWNWLADEDGDDPDAAVLHWTAGIPAIPHYRDAPAADEWRSALAEAVSTC